LQNFRSACLASIAALALAGAPRAQCAGPTVSITSYGQTCEFFAQPSLLQGKYDPSTCLLTLSLSPVKTCCNTFARNHILLIGLRPIEPGRPHELLVNGCLLSVLPDIALAQPVSSGGVWQFRLPAVSVPLQVNFQGLTDYFTTIGFSSDFQTSNALRVGLL